MAEPREWGAALVDPRRPWTWRVDGPLAFALAAIAVVHRLAHASRTPYTVDSVLFALATERYDVMALRPHPPGYPLFVALGKVLLPVSGGDANAAFVLASALFSGVAVAALYGLVREWGSIRAAVAAAALFSFAPAFAFNGVLALSYTAEAAASIVVAWLAWRAWTRPSPGRLAALGATWALGVGIRQSLFLFLAPLVGLALLEHPPAWPRGRAALAAMARRALAAGGSALAVALAWFVPMVAATGGLAEWRHATRLQSDQVVFADAVWVRGWVALEEHWERLAFYVHWEAGLLAPVLLLLAAAGFLVRGRRSGRATEEPHASAGRPWPRCAGLLLAIWLAPALLFYLLVFDGWDKGPIGYVLTVLPGLYAAGVLLADHGLRRIAAAQRPALGRVVHAVGMVLLLLPLPWLADDAHELIRSEAVAHDRWAADWQQIESEYPADRTAILTWQSWSHVKWSFPDHLAWTYFPTYSVEGKRDWALLFAMRHYEDEERFIEMVEAGPGRPEHPIPDWVETIIVFDFQLCGENGEVRRLAPDVEVEEAFFANGARHLRFQPGPQHTTVESLFTAEALGEGARAPGQQPEVAGAASACVGQPPA